jgi:pyrimidine operon attenuation protein/uracil phosphoribosyltransferase
MSDRRQVLDDRGFARTLQRIALEILRLTPHSDRIVLVGIQRRGVELAARLAKLLGQETGAVTLCGALDITLYRDDLETVGPRPIVGKTELPCNLEGRHVWIVDDVLYTGRTVRAALDAIAEYGRPRAVQLAVLVDRGHRELPIRPDFVGKNLPTSSDEEVLASSDGVEIK